MIVVALGGAATGGNYYMKAEFITRDEPAPYGHVYVELAAQNLKALFDSEDELARLQARQSRGECDSECLQRIATLKERIRNLKK